MLRQARLLPSQPGQKITITTSLVIHIPNVSTCKVTGDRPCKTPEPEAMSVRKVALTASARAEGPETAHGHEPLACISTHIV